MTPISIWPIALATLAAFAVGAVWYSPAVFGRQWMTLAKIGSDELARAQARGMWKLYLYQLCATAVTFAVMAFFVSAMGVASAAEGAFVAFLAWLGFPVMISVGETLWSSKPIGLTMITLGATLVSWVIGGAILGGAI